MANLPAAIVLGIASAGVYGTSLVVQHRVVHTMQVPGLRGYVQILKSPVWLMAVAGDLFGFVLQVGALSLGPVVVIQPLSVLMLPVALVVGYSFGGPKPTRADYGACALLAGSLSVFLWIVGETEQGSTPLALRTIGVLVLVLALVLGLGFSTASLATIPRAAVLGGAAGVCWGTLAAFVNAASDRYDDGGIQQLFNDPRGYVPLIAIAVLGVLGMALTMLSFKAGSLAVVLPVNLCADPLSAIIFGALLLGQKVPLGIPELLGYSLCFCGLALAAIRLAKPVVETLHAQETDGSEAELQSP
ncbi:MAG TPA: DMT family transporter [Jatrophihabitans sp.]|jgi:drug/metabolite transporter (DMT)-like permease